MTKREKEYLSDPVLSKEVEPALHQTRKTREPADRMETVVVAPDGGYGWVILVASFVVNVIVDGIIFNFGMIKKPIEQSFGATSSSVAWVFSMQAGFYLLAGPIVSGLCNRYGARTITVLGSFIAAGALAASAFSNSLIMMLVFYGLIAGIGFGMAYLPAIVIVGEYFEKRRAFATGLAVSGSGIGGFVFAAILEELLPEFEWRGAVLILAGIALNGAVCGALFRPLLPERRKEEGEVLPRSESFLRRIQDARDARINKLNVEGGAEGGVGGAVEMTALERIDETDVERKVETTYVPGSIGRMDDVQQFKQSGNSLHRRPSTASRKSTHSPHPSHPSHPSRPLPPDAFYGGSVHNLPEVIAAGSVEDFRREHISNTNNATDVNDAKNTSGCLGVLRQMLDFSLLKSPTFLLTCFTSFLTLAGFFIPFIYIKDLVEAEQGGLTSAQGTVVLQAISVTNTLGRIVVGFISDYPRVDPIVVACSALIVGGLATCFLPFYSGYVTFIIYSLVFGFSISAFAALRSIILVDLFGITMLNNSFGLQMLFQGLATLIGAPIAGALTDASGSFYSAFYFAGGLLAVSGALLFPAKIVQRWEKKTFGRRFS